MAAAGDSGVMRSTDGGKNWKSTLPDPQAGAVWLVFDPDNLESCVRRHAAQRRGGRRRRRARRTPVTTPATDSQIYRFGRWRRHLEEDQRRTDLPGGNFGTIALAVAPGTKGQRVYDYVAQGMFRSDDGGEHWTRATRRPAAHRRRPIPRRDRRPARRQYSLRHADLAVSLHRRRQNVGILHRRAQRRRLQLCVDRSYQRQVHDSGGGSGHRNQHGRRAAPGPPGSTSPPGRCTTSPPITASLSSCTRRSRIAAPSRRRFSGAAARSRIATGTPPTASNRRTLFPIPPTRIISTPPAGTESILRINKITGQTQHIFERTPKYHESGSPPMGFSPFDPKTFYLATQYLLATHDKGMHWEAASPDLTAGGGEELGPDAIGTVAIGRGPGPRHQLAGFFAQRRERDLGGTSNGLIQLTRDGGAHWTNVAPTDLKQPRRVRRDRAMEASQATRRGLLRSWWRPRRRGWRSTGRCAAAHLSHRRLRPELEDSSMPVCPTARRGRCAKIPKIATWFSPRWKPACSSPSMAATSGSRWNLNLPAAWCRDLAIEQNDLIVATYGRALVGHRRHQPACANWPRRRPRIAASNAYLFAPAPADPHAMGYLYRHALEPRRGRGRESARWRDRRLLFEVAAPERYQA